MRVAARTGYDKIAARIRVFQQPVQV
jgi:hypothetical protein